mmetsp:Transcript_58548/g.104096  ORF Transcript_58548/g.104096 Transcript_58548/m.104096 type:complete len:239 (-) Transcript_58548:9-725(-)
MRTAVGEHSSSRVNLIWVPPQTLLAHQEGWVTTKSCKKMHVQRRLQSIAKSSTCQQQIQTLILIMTRSVAARKLKHQQHQEVPRCGLQCNPLVRWENSQQTSICHGYKISYKAAMQVRAVALHAQRLLVLSQPKANISQCFRSPGKGSGSHHYSAQSNHILQDRCNSSFHLDIGDSSLRGEKEEEGLGDSSLQQDLGDSNLRGRDSTFRKRVRAGEVSGVLLVERLSHLRKLTVCTAV